MVHCTLNTKHGLDAIVEHLHTPVYTPVTGSHFTILCEHQRPMHIMSMWHLQLMRALLFCLMVILCMTGCLKSIAYYWSLYFNEGFLIRYTTLVVMPNNDVKTK